MAGNTSGAVGAKKRKRKKQNEEGFLVFICTCQLISFFSFSGSMRVFAQSLGSDDNDDEDDSDESDFEW